MNWLNYLLRGLTLVPTVVQGVEQMHAGAPGATKKQLAMEALGFGSVVANSVLPPELQPAADAAAQLASATIDGVVAVMNAAKQAAPAVAAVPAAKVFTNTSKPGQ